MGTLEFMVLVLGIGFILIISNQYAALKGMRDMQRSLDDINQKLRDLGKERK